MRVASPASSQLTQPRLDESFTTSFELVSDLLRSLAGTSDPRDRVTAMDSIVKAVEQQVRIKYELKLEDSLPSYVPAAAILQR